MEKMICVPILEWEDMVSNYQLIKSLHKKGREFVYVESKNGVFSSAYYISKDEYSLKVDEVLKTKEDSIYLLELRLEKSYHKIHELESKQLNKLQIIFGKYYIGLIALLCCIVSLIKFIV